MGTPLKHLLLTTVEDPFNVRSWSGIPYSLREALEGQVERLTVFSPGPPSRNPLDVARRLWHGGEPAKYPLWMTEATLKKNARELQAKIEEVRPDAVLSISSQCVIYLERPGRPVFMFSDAPWLAWREAYRGTISEPVKMAWFAEREAETARRLDGLCFGSAWAVGEAERLYARRSDVKNADAAETDAARSLRERLHVTPLGANWRPAMSREEIFASVEERSGDELQLLYVGKDWERKGGPLAVEVTRLLHERGRRVRLNIVGCTPELAQETASFVTMHGLLSQDDPKQREVLAGLFQRSHFLLVPTLAECFGLVFAEAQAYALPPISRAIHALPSVVVDGVTGLLMDPGAPASAYVTRILGLLDDPAAYRQMAVQARERFENLLNWNKTAETIVRHMSAAMGQ